MRDSALIITKLLQIPRVGPRTAAKIYNRLIVSDALHDDDAIIASLRDIFGERYSADVVSASFKRGGELYSRSLDAGIGFVSIADETYPIKLRRLLSPPVLLSYRGSMSVFNDAIAAAIIGTRHPTEHGRMLAMRAGALFAENKFTVVGGLAAGCGAAGHMGCLSKGGLTAAVVGHGLQHVYPKENKVLAQKIIDSGGALISEYFLDDPPSKEKFIARNRIQAGLSDLIFVAEASENSGTRHTVAAALQCDVPVYIYEHPEKYKCEETTKGNQAWITAGKGMPIKSRHDFELMMERFRKV